MKQFVLEEIMRLLGTAIEHTLKDNDLPFGFALIVFDFNNPGSGNYISNAARDDMIKSLRETADRIEKNEIIPPLINRTIQ